MIVRVEEFLARTRLDREMLEICIREAWISPAGSAEAPSFSEADLARADLIADLMLDLNVNIEGVDVILSLVDKMHALQGTVAELTTLARKRRTLLDL